MLGLGAAMVRWELVRRLWKPTFTFPGAVISELGAVISELKVGLFIFRGHQHRPRQGHYDIRGDRQTARKSATVAKNSY